MAREFPSTADGPGRRLSRRSLLANLLCLSVVGCREPRTAVPAVLPAGALSSPPTDLVYSRALGEGKRALCIAPAGGGPERRLTDGSASDGLPRWSPDGKTLAFLSDCDGPQSLWLMGMADGTPRLLVRHGRRSVLGNPHWNRDARRIVISSNHDFGHQIYIVDVVSGNERRLSSLLSGGCEPRFSFDGQRVVHVTRGHHRPTSRLVETDLASGAQKTLVDWPALNYDPAYSPDGTELAFASNLTGEYQVYRLRLADGKIFRVTSRPGEAREPDYRPPR